MFVKLLSTSSVTKMLPANETYLKEEAQNNFLGGLAQII